MNYIISIIHPDALDAMTELCQQLGMPMSIATHGRGTATRSMMDLLGIENNFKRIVLNVASPEKTRELIRGAEAQAVIWGCRDRASPLRYP